MKKTIHRRQFLKKGALGISTLAVVEAFSGFNPLFAAFATEDNTSTTAKVPSNEQRGKKIMKVLGINGSSRQDGNTAILIKEVFKELQKAGIETELVQLADQVIAPCRACFACAQTGSCIFRNDAFVGLFEKMVNADGILLGSPVYSADVSAKMKAFLERSSVVADMKPGLLKHKVGAAVAAARRGGGMATVDTMNHFFLNHEVFVVGSTYWNMVYGRMPGDVLKDEEGINNMKNLGQNMAFLIHKIND